MTGEACVDILIEKELGRHPKKSDFDPTTVMVIKSHLGPWPRALEAAGLKQISEQWLAKLARRKRKRTHRGQKND